MPPLPLQGSTDSHPHADSPDSLPQALSLALWHFLAPHPQRFSPYQFHRLLHHCFSLQISLKSLKAALYWQISLFPAVHHPIWYRKRRHLLPAKPYQRHGPDHTLFPSDDHCPSSVPYPPSVSEPTGLRLQSLCNHRTLWSAYKSDTFSLHYDKFQTYE